MSSALCTSLFVDKVFAGEEKQNFPQNESEKKARSSPTASSTTDENKVLRDLEYEPPKNLIDFTNRSLKTLQNFPEKHLKHVLKLNFSYNKLQDISGILHKDALFPLKCLFLTSNLLSSLPPTLAQIYPNLIILKLDDNKISSLEALAEEKFNKLTTLDLSKNKITVLNGLKKMHIPSLRDLNLQSNFIVDFSPLTEGKFYSTDKNTHLSCDRFSLDVSKNPNSEALFSDFIKLYTTPNIRFINVTIDDQNINACTRIYSRIKNNHNHVDIKKRS